MKRGREDPQVLSPEKIKGELTTSDATSFLHTIKDAFQGDGERKYKEFVQLMKDFKDQLINTYVLVESVKNLFKGYNDLLLGFDKYLPNGYKITLLPEEENLEFLRLVSKIKARVDDEATYTRFLETLNEWREQRITKTECLKEMTKLFKDYEDLAVDLFSYVTKQSEDSEPASLSSLPAMSALPHHKGEAFRSPMHPNKKIKLRRKPKYVSDQLEDDEDIGNHSSPISTTKYTVPINELDLSRCTQETYSYWRLPEDYQVESTRYRDAIGRETLNDHYVSAPSGSECSSFNHKRKNRYEESLFQCEDDRYEMDMVIESVRSAIKHLKDLQENITSNTDSTKSQILIEEHLTGSDLSCIERLYGVHGFEFIGLLKTNIRGALPVILKRLEQKREEWQSCRSGFQKVWAKVYAKNHKKLLEYPSFSFKEQGFENLSTECLVSETKDINEKKDHLPQATPVRKSISFPMDLEFGYCDSQTHEDIYLLTKYYSEERYTSEESDKVMKLWTALLAPMFGAEGEDRSKHVSWSLQASEINSQNDPQVFYGNDSYYKLFKLHQALYEKIQSAKKYSDENRNEPDNPTSYARFRKAHLKLIDGSIDITKFEEKCGTAFGPLSYVVFTFHESLKTLVKQLHRIAADERDTKLVQLYREPHIQPYHKKARSLLQKANMYRIKYSLGEACLSIRLMNRLNNHPEGKILTLVDDEKKQGLFSEKVKKQR